MTVGLGNMEVTDDFDKGSLYEVVKSKPEWSGLRRYFRKEGGVSIYTQLFQEFLPYESKRNRAVAE